MAQPSGPICCTENGWQGKIHGNAFAMENGTHYQENFYEYIYYSYPNAMRADFFIDINHQRANGMASLSFLLLAFFPPAGYASY
jgi:hypothetical protein